jgi:hypothetical protein
MERNGNGNRIDNDDIALIPPTTNDIVNATLIKNDKAQSISPLTGSDERCSGCLRN